MIGNRRKPQYHTTHQKGLTAICAELLLRLYLEDTCFAIWTYHDALQWMQNLVQATANPIQCLLKCPKWYFTSFIMLEVNTILSVCYQVFYQDYLPPGRTALTGDAIPDMLVLSPGNENEKVFIGSPSIFGVYYNTAFNFVSLELPSLRTFRTSRPYTNTAPPKLTKLPAKQAKDTFCQQVSTTIGMARSYFSYDLNVITVCTADLNDAIQTVVSNSILPHLLHLRHYLKLTSKLDKRRMYDTMQFSITGHTWLRMFTRKPATSDFSDCVRNSAYHKRKHHLKSFPSNRPIEFIPMDILDQLPEMTTGSQVIIIISDRCTKVTLAIPSSKTFAPHVPSILSDHWTCHMGSPFCLSLKMVCSW